MEDFNTDVKRWANETLRVIKDTAYLLGIQHRANSPSILSSINAITVKTYTSHGKVSRIAYNIRRHLVFVEKGVGKETPIDMVGKTKRTAKPFFNDPIAENINDLADIVGNKWANELTKGIKIK